MSLIFIDRRKALRKSLPNRVKLMQRIQNFVKNTNLSTIGGNGVSGASGVTTPVAVARDALLEPYFCYAVGGHHDFVLIGNDELVRGDLIELDQGEGGQGDGSGDGAGQGGSGQDGFVVNVATSEYMDLYFDDCELPNLTKEKMVLDDPERKIAGFTTTGSPAQLSIVRSYKQMIGRRRALTASPNEKLRELQEELKQFEDLTHPQINYFSQNELADVIYDIQERIRALKIKIATFSSFDQSDLRYRKHELVPVTQAEAVFMMIMDISGSMDEQKKTIARKWFALLYAFIKRRHPKCALVFIAHTETAVEMLEDEFFSTRESGGTIVSPSYELALEIIKERYGSGNTNIYISQASDGDNWESDTDATQAEIRKLLPLVQYFSYVEVGRINSWRSGDTTLWNALQGIKDANSSIMSMTKLETNEDVFTRFRQVFKKRT